MNVKHDDNGDDDDDGGSEEEEKEDKKDVRSIYSVNTSLDPT